MVFVFLEILFKILLFKGGVLIYAEHCIYIFFRGEIYLLRLGILGAKYLFSANVDQLLQV